MLVLSINLVKHLSLMKIKRLFTLLILLSLTGCTTWSTNSESTQSHSPRSSQNPSTSIPTTENQSVSNAPRPINQTSGSPTPIKENNVEKFYVVFGRRYAVMKDSTGFQEQGIASWYGHPFHGQKTSNGEIYDMHQMTAAHKHLPLPTFVKVTRNDNGRSIIVRVNDRGPFKDDRIIDLSFAAAQQLDMIKAGTTQVSIQALDDLNADIISQRKQATPVFVQVGSFQEQDNALSSQDLLKSIGINNSRIIKSSNAFKQSLFRLQVGPLSTGQEYDNLINQLKTIGIHDTVIIR